MIVLPKDQPLFENLNSYYLRVERLIEHCQGELGAGGIHFKSPHAEGVIFFDQGTIVNGVLQQPEGLTEGPAAVERLLQTAAEVNFAVAVYRIAADQVYFWAHLQHVEDYYKNLSADFTELDGLIKKMSSEKLTGYIDVVIGEGQGGGVIFFENGTILGCACSWDQGQLIPPSQGTQLLIEKSIQSGGMFNVSRMVLTAPAAAEITDLAPEEFTMDVLAMLGEFLSTLERRIKSTKKIKADFDTLLKRKFVEKVEQYDFLDPFAAEFHYAAGRATFSGRARDDQLAQGVISNGLELADELQIGADVRQDLKPWSRKYAAEIKALGLSL